MRALQMYLTPAIAVALLVPTATAATEETVLEVKGMTCESCAGKIETALERLDGVHDARVELSRNEALVTHDPGRVSLQELVDAIEALGYQAGPRPGPEVAAEKAIDGAEDGAPAGKACEHPGGPAADAGGQLTDEQVATVADYIVRSIVAGGDKPNIAFTSEQIAEATGIVIPFQDEGRIQKAALDGLQEHPDALARVADQSSRCAQYDACSLDGDLSAATGETLDMYAREKQEDGLTFDNQLLPSFDATDIGLRRVRSEDLRGRPAVLALLAGHCTHSMDTFPILQELTRTYEAKGLRVVGIVLNSGTPDDVAAWVAYFQPEYDVWVYEDASLGDLVGSHLVPTYLFVDEDGRMKGKLVGYKESGSVSEWVGRMFAAGASATRR